jgi:DNA repair photolyase
MDQPANDRVALPTLFPEALAEDLPTKFGHATVSSVEPRSILTPASGFMRDYDYTLNPYGGCTFGCTYCYAAFFARDRQLKQSWGYWVAVKANAVRLLRSVRKSLAGKTVYMSSVTDPYQPIEKRLGLVRMILEELLRHQPRLVVQTRSPLVTRDLDLLKRFQSVQVNMTVTTDSEQVRRAFEPLCPPANWRLEAIRTVREAGVPACITLTPLLPLEAPSVFADALRATGVRKFVVQPFHPERGKFTAGTREEALALFRAMHWDYDAYRRAVDILRDRLPELHEGREGFAPL